jgi:hypothetical protein
MNSIYDKGSNDVVISRINALTPETKAQWGEMTVDQMFKHTNEAIKIAFGENKIKVNFLMKFLGKMLKKKVFYGGDMGKNSPTAKEFIFNQKYDFESSKKDLITNFSRFAQGQNVIKVMDHPFWGKMTYEDWDALMWKHMDHHLRQFGV